MTKEDIYVEITNEQERLRAIEILQKAREKIYKDSGFKFPYKLSQLSFYKDKNEWGYHGIVDKTKITLDQLEEMLMPKQSNVDLLSTIKQIQQHLQNDYPKGTEIKISKDKIEIYQS